MALIDGDIPKPTPTPQTIEQGEYQLRQIASRMRVDLQQKLTRMKATAQRHGVSNMAAQLNSTNAGDAAAFSEIFTDGKALLAKLDQAAADDVGDLS